MQYNQPWNLFGGIGVIEDAKNLECTSSWGGEINKL